MSRWASMRAALRIARRDALRHRARSLLVVVMIALPVLALTAADVLARTMQLSVSEKLDRALGHADAELTVLGDRVTQLPPGGAYSSVDGNFTAPGTARYDKAVERMRAALPAGSRVIPRVNASAPAGSDGRLVAGVEITGLDLREPMTRGLLRVTHGRRARASRRGRRRRPPRASAPAASRQHADSGVSALHRRRLHAQPAGLRSRHGGDTSVRGAGAAGRHDDDLPGPSPQPITWPMVQRLNRIGVGVQSRFVVEHPPPRPAGRRPTHTCLTRPRGRDRHRRGRARGARGRAPCRRDVRGGCAPSTTRPRARRGRRR